MASVNTYYKVKTKKGSRSLALDIKGNVMVPNEGIHTRRSKCDPGFKCPDCFRQFRTLQYLRIHYRLIHHKKYEENQGPKQVST